MEDTARRRGYGVKLVRGPFLRLAPHPESCEDEGQLADLVSKLRVERPDVLLAADLFAGAGGLSLGLDRAGFKTVVAVDHYTEAVETHRHHFPGMSLDWDLADPAKVERLASILTSVDVALIAGGPPCQPFSKAGRSGIRYRVLNGLREPHDERRDLWRSFVEVIRLVRPRAVLMENVPDMVLDREMFILRAMVEELESLGYSVEGKVLDSWRFGVPQFRQRLILVALRDSLSFKWPIEAAEKVSVWNAIGDMPEVAGGFRHANGADGWTHYDGPITAFQRLMRAGAPPHDAHRLYDHITRPVRDDDRGAFDIMGADTRYSDLPSEFKRYRQDIFNDKYKRLDEDDLSRTITAHIAKDGYWYIHPRQSRTITVREAARLQTFPDHFRFAGPPSAAFKQIGNAVPPLLAQAVGRAIADAVATSAQAGPSSGATAIALGHWYRSVELRGVPWLRAESWWQVVCAETMLDRAAPEVVSSVWPLLQQWKSPQDIVDNQDNLREIARWIRREDRASQIIDLANALSDPATGCDNDFVLLPATMPGVTQAALDLVSLVTAQDGEEPVLIGKGVLRVAARVSGENVDRKNRLTDGRLAVARLIGLNTESADAHKALIEIAASLCRPQETKCDLCPLEEICVSSRAAEMASARLF